MVDYVAIRYFPAIWEIHGRAGRIFKNRTDDQVELAISATMKMVSDFKDRQHEKAMAEFISERAAQLHREGGWELEYLEHDWAKQSSHEATEEDIQMMLRRWPDYVEEKPAFPEPMDNLTALSELTVSGYPYDDIDGFEEVAEAELYAALALATVRSAETCLAAGRLVNAKSGEVPWEASAAVSAGAILVNAMEILCHAERAPKVHWTKEDEERELRQREASQRTHTSLARRGAHARDLRYEPLRQLAVELVRAKNYKSTRSAAMNIAPVIIERSRDLGLNMSEAQAVSTISGWLRAAGLPANVVRQQASVAR